MTQLVSLAPDQVKKAAAWFFLILLAALPVLWIVQSQKTVYAEPLAIAFSGGRTVQKATSPQLLDTLSTNYDRGFTRFQLKLAATPSGQFVCQPVRADIMPMGPLPFDESCTPAALAGWLSHHPQAVLVLEIAAGDPTPALNEIKSQLSDFATRIVVQLGDPAASKAVAALGYTQIVWLVRDVGLKEDAILDQARAHRVQAVVLPVRLVTEDFVRTLGRRNIDTYAYLVDSCQMLRDMQESGVRAVYTNGLAPGFCAGEADTLKMLTGLDEEGRPFSDQYYPSR